MNLGDHGLRKVEDLEPMPLPDFMAGIFRIENHFKGNRGRSHNQNMIMAGSMR